MPIEYALKLLNNKTAEIVKSSQSLQAIDEIRLRLSRPISVTKGGKIEILQPNVLVEKEDIEFTFKNAFNYSLHCYSKELANGYITTEGGNRVGLCGTAVVPSHDFNSIESVKYISSLNIRISRQVMGCAEKLYNSCLCRYPSGVLIIGPPSCGKTTLLRDISRLASKRYKVAVIDEMNEISYSHSGIPQMDVGINSDVFVGYPKHIGIRTAVKVMSPDIIVCDEIGSFEDTQALEYALHSGVKLISAVHATNESDALSKVNISRLIDDKAFDFMAVIDSNTRKYTVSEIV